MNNLLKAFVETQPELVGNKKIMRFGFQPSFFNSNILLGMLVKIPPKSRFNSTDKLIQGQIAALKRGETTGSLLFLIEGRLISEDSMMTLNDFIF